MTNKNNQCDAAVNYGSIHQLNKKEDGKERKPIFPVTPIQAVYDARTGASLEAILAQFNAIYVQYQGTPESTRNIIPEVMRRAGLTITYMDMDSNTITERANSAVQKDNDHWALDVNWSRVDELSLSGDISVSSKGTWIINGKDTGIKSVGPKGDTGLTPWLKTIDNKLHFSYDNVTWEPCSENIAAWFRFNATSSDSQAGTIGRIQISRDNKTWTDLSPEFRNYLRIQGYVATTSALPANQVVGTIYGVGPTYAADDTAQTNPIYRLHVWNGTSWVDNGQFTSIAAGVVQETGDSETEVMSQKAVSTKLSELGSKLNGLTETIINIDVVKGVSINTTQIAAGATPVHFYKKSYLDLHLSDDDVLDNVGIVTVYLLLTDGNAVTVPIPKNTTTRTYIPEDCNYIGFYKSGTQILGNGTLTFSVTNANVDELFDKTNDLEKDALITKQNIDSLIEKSYSIGENIAVYKELKGYTSVDGILKNTSASSSFNSNVYDISNYSHIGVCYALGTNSSTFAVLLSNDENFVNGNKVINLKDGKSSFIFSTEGYKYVAFGVGKTNADYYITKVEYNDLLEDSFAQKDYSFVLGGNINNTTYDSSQKVNLKKGVEHIIKFLINSSWELHELTHITLSLFSEKGLYLKEIVKVDTEFRFIPTEDIIGVGLYFNPVFALGDGVLQLFIGRKGLDNKYTYLVEELNKKSVNLYGGKTCLYIGDSISTLDNYKWKGFLETNYNVSFVRDKSGELAPANGGITIRPAITESEDLAAKSIWYRCANNRMSIYDFDMISLFGGTNDMTNENLVIGTVDDTAYVDDASTFDSTENVTDIRPASLTLASALRGCILMLKRDFPNKEIVIPTVMPCGGIYGNWKDSVSGLRASEAIAEMQMKMAEKYNLKAVPLYWSMNYPNLDTNRIWLRDGVHPNIQGALNIQRMFAQILCL